MLGDADLQILGNQLDAVARADQQHHECLQKLLDQSRDLVESYRLLKSDYEEEKEAREKYKKLARGQERNPFALVLVDGDGYLFKEHLIRAGSDGGVDAARLLGDSVKELLRSKLGNDADQCRVMARAYANILGLSKSMARAGITGYEARSLSSFTSSFTGSQELFDYVDAGDRKEGAGFKIREIFRLFADNNQCKHIFFAGCHDVGYLSMLMPYRGRADRITLIKGASFQVEYESLDLPVRMMPSVFMSVPVGDGKATTRPPSTTSNSTKICKHFVKGSCKFGNECRNLHPVPNKKNSKAGDESPLKLPSTPAFSQASSTQLRRLQASDFATLLPAMITQQEKKLIPVNKDGERIDTYCPYPPEKSWIYYHRTFKKHKLCNKYHLGGVCRDIDCQYGHTEAESPALEVMKYILRQTPCRRGGHCRSLKCYTGHICQKENCKGCRFPRHAHTLELQVTDWVAPLDEDEVTTSDDFSDSLLIFDEDC
ncbi:hypothetical protein MPDQ_003984 [Monascus purpureus]|uniref:C3H1-type domain-containing protein n=1 Tax=Monascus purpureus TaxID=5098 RepID=A0A507QYX4_MONPU|nr:hypothetical protein MPDQ_003984 [Monascus purpureus]BDD63849.1 hypothetical protein MAP00_008706 [Monascus purpureus]